MSDQPRVWRALAIAFLLVAVSAPALAAEGGLQLLPEIPVKSWADALGMPYGFTLVGLILLFAILVIPLNQLVFKPLLRVLDERDERIAGTRTRAEQLERETDEVLSRYEAQVAEVREEAEQDRRSVLEGARSDAVGTTGGARSEAESQIEGARNEIAQALESARASMRGETEELARQAAASVLGRPL